MWASLAVAGSPPVTAMEELLRSATAPAAVTVPSGWQRTPLAPLNKTWGEVTDAQVKVSPDGSRAIAYWNGYRRTTKRGAEQFATWTSRTGWRPMQTMAGQTGAFAITPDVRYAAFVSVPGEDTDDPGPLTLRTLDIGANTWSAPSTLPESVVGPLDWSEPMISADGRTVMVSTGRRDYRTDRYLPFSVTWHDNVNPVAAAVPHTTGWNSRVTLSADGNTAFAVYLEEWEAVDGPRPAGLEDGVFSTRYVDGSWTTPQRVPVGDLNRFSMEDYALIPVVTPDLSRVMLIWNDADDPWDVAKNLKTAYWENGTWRAGETIPKAGGAEVRASADGSRALITYVYPVYGKRYRTVAAYRWWTPAGWSPEKHFPSPGNGLLITAINPTLTSDGKHAAAGLQIYRPNGGASYRTTARATVWTGSGWTRPTPLLPEVWAERKEVSASVGLSGDGSRASASILESYGDYWTWSMARWTRGSGWTGRTRVLSHELHGGVGTTAYSNDGKVAFTLIEALSGNHSLIALGSR